MPRTTLLQIAAWFSDDPPSRRAWATRHLAALLLLPVALLAGCVEPGDEHPWLTSPSIDEHARYLPLSATPHDPSAAGAKISCEDCHPGASFRAFECTGCHTPAKTDPVHVGLAGYDAGGVTSSACYGCHPQGIGVAPSEHGRFFPIETAAHPAVCTQCHTDEANRSDVSRLACGTCHAGLPGFDVAHARVKDYPVAAGPEWCLRCHAGSQVDRIDAHGTRSGPEGKAGPGDRKHDTHCFQCHTMIPPLFGGPGPGIADRPWAQDWKVVTCDKCH